MPKKTITIPAGGEESAAIRVDDVVAASFFVEDFGQWTGTSVKLLVCDTPDGEFCELPSVTIATIGGE